LSSPEDPLDEEGVNRTATGCVVVMLVFLIGTIPFVFTGMLSSMAAVDYAFFTIILAIANITLAIFFWNWYHSKS
jgi:hypothetical protein